MVSAEVTEKIQSMPNFLDTIGLTLLANMVRSKTTSPPAFTDPAVVAALKERKSFRSYLLYLVNTYKSCLARSVRTGQADMTAEQRLTIVQSSPWAIHLQKILPQVLALLRNVHALWDRSAHWADGDVAKLTLELAPVLDMTPAERAVILGATPSEVAEEEQQRSQHAVSSLATHLHDIRNSLRLIKETVYALLGQATYLVPGEYFYASTSPIASEPTFAQCILDHVFGSVASMDTYHWRVLIQTFVKPFILNCPAERLNDTLRPVLIPVAAYLAKKLDAEWKDLIKRGLVQAGTLAEAQSMECSNGMTFGDDDVLDVNDPSSMSEEVVQQKMLRDLTRAWTEVWSVVFQLSLKPDTPSAIAVKGKSSATVTSDAATVKPKTAAAIFPLHKDLVEMTLSCMVGTSRVVHATLVHKLHRRSGNCRASAVHVPQCHDMERHANVHASSARVLQATSVAHYRRQFPSVSRQAFDHGCSAGMLEVECGYGARVHVSVYSHAYAQALRDGYHQEGHDTLVALLVDGRVRLVASALALSGGDDALRDTLTR